MLGRVFQCLVETPRSRRHGRVHMSAAVAVASVLTLAASSTAAWARIRSADDGTSPLVSLVAELSTSQASATPPVEVTMFVPDEGTGVPRNAPTAVVFRNSEAAAAQAGTQAAATGQDVRVTSEATGAILSSVYATGENSAVAPAMRGQRSYYAAFAKAGTRFGPAGAGGIYVREPNGVTRRFVTIPHVVPGPASPDGAGDTTSGTYPNGGDYLATEGGIHLPSESLLNSAGTVSLGGLALDNGERWLYTVNLNNRTVYGVDTWAATPTALALPPLPAMSAPSSCNGHPEDLRPGGLTVWRGRLLLATICTAAASGSDADVSADIWIYDIEGQTWMADQAMHTTFGEDVPSRPVRHWSATVLGAQPSAGQLLPLRLDITESGGLLLGFRNRGADTTTSPTADDRGLVVVAPAVAGGWADPFLGRPASQAPVGPGDLLGAAAAIPGSPWGLVGEEIAATRAASDPAVAPGLVWFDRQSPLPVGHEATTERTRAVLPGSLGGVTLMAGWRSVTTTVFRDTNGDGIQQPSELPLDGVRLNILLAGDDTIRAIATSGEIDGKHGQMRMYLPPFNRYRIQVDPTSFATSGVAPGARRSLPGNELRLGVRNEQATATPIGITLVPAASDVLGGTVAPNPAAATPAEPMPAAGRRTTLVVMAAGTLLLMGAVLVRVTRLSVKTRHRLRHAGANGEH